MPERVLGRQRIERVLRPGVLRDQFLADVGDDVRLPALAQRGGVPALPSPVRPRVPAHQHAGRRGPLPLQPVRLGRPADRDLAEGVRASGSRPGPRSPTSTSGRPTGRTTVERIHYIEDGMREKRSRCATDDLVFVTNGSMTAASRLGSQNVGPHARTDGRPATGRCGRSSRGTEGTSAALRCSTTTSTNRNWESFTVTCRDPEFFRLHRGVHRQRAGDGAPGDDQGFVLADVDRRCLSAALPEPAGGRPGLLGLRPVPDGRATSSSKTMSDCTGEEILIELCSHLRFTEQLPQILDIVPRASRARCRTSPASSWCAARATARRWSRRVRPTSRSSGSSARSPRTWSSPSSTRSARRKRLFTSCSISTRNRPPCTEASATRSSWSRPSASSSHKRRGAGDVHRHRTC